MRFLIAIFVIVVVCASSMYFFNPVQFNSILARGGITSWQAPIATSAPSTATASTPGGAPDTTANIATKTN